MLSIIIPVYNGEKYILECLESIVNQDFSDIEVLIVDDGSTDSTRGIAEKYLSENNIKHRIITKINGGQGSARNRALSEDLAEYAVFVDQDDKLPEGILKKYVSEMQDADILVCGYQRVSDEGKVLSSVKLEDCEWSKYKIITPWAKCFRTDFLKNNNISFLEAMLGEDIYFIVNAYSYNPKIKVIDALGYYWRDNKKSVSNTIHKRLGADNNILFLFEEIKKLPRFEVICEDELFTFFMIKTAAFQVMNTFCASSFSENRKLATELRQWLKENLRLYDSVRKKCIVCPKGETIGIRLITWLIFGIKG